MGWFWDSNTGNTSSNDAYKKLDPALRAFLDKESPLKYEDTKAKAPRPTPSAIPPSQDAAPNTFRAQLGIEDSRTKPPSLPGEVPSESLFQDGRYAHLWKNYRPQAQVEAAARTDADRLAAVVEAYQDRKAAIGRAALENCVDFQIAEKECFSNGGWKQRLTMCRAEAKEFNRCYTMQARFLKALGYLSTQRSDEEEERIQMHADKLYHEMLEREKLADEAKRQGLEAPVLPPLIQPEKTVEALGENSAWARTRRKAMQAGVSTNLSSFSPEKQEEIKKRLDGMSKEERELELQLIAAERNASIEYAEQVQGHIEDDRRHRAERRERGKETVGDTIRRLWER